MRSGAAALLALWIAGCGSERLEPEIARQLTQVMAMPSCAISAPARIEPAFYGLNGAAYGAYLSVSESCKGEWWDRMRASGHLACTEAVEFRECSIGNTRPGQSGILVMLRRDDMLVLIRYAPIYRGKRKS